MENKTKKQELEDKLRELNLETSQTMIKITDRENEPDYKHNLAKQDLVRKMRGRMVIIRSDIAVIKSEMEAINKGK